MDSILLSFFLTRDSILILLSFFFDKGFHTIILMLLLQISISKTKFLRMVIRMPQEKKNGYKKGFPKTDYKK